MIIYCSKDENAMISIVAALDSKGGIGKSNDLLFRIPEDFKRMKKLTLGHPLIMGRRTFESIGRVLPGRTNIVISRNPAVGKLIEDVSNLILCPSLEEALRVAQGKPGSDEIIIFGGGQIFKQALEKDLVDVLHLTQVEGDYKADTFFPDYSKFKKILSSSSGTSGGYNYTFLDLVRA